MNRRSFLGIPQHSSTTRSQQLASSSLEPWQPKSGEWNISAVNHLYNRLGFGLSYSEAITALSKTPSQIIDELMDDALVTTLMPDPPEGYEKWMFSPAYQGSEYAKAHAEDVLEHDIKADLRGWWAELMMQPSMQLREKLVLFWHNHFVVEELKIYYSVHFWRYFEYLREHCWGNFEQMVKDITIMPAMLKYLDGIWSEKAMINENYARELMELFTMGIEDRYGNKNYTQEDVRNMAFAVTGWRFRFEEPPPYVMPHYFADYYFDFETKRSLFGAEEKIYGIKASNDPRIEADVIELLFERRSAAIAWHIADKIYRNFIYRGDLPDSSADLIQELADTLIASNWNMKPMLAKLFKSEHFFDPTHRGGAIKSPYDFMMGIFRRLNIPITPSEGGSLWWYAQDNGQVLGNPTNVKGWVGYRAWINTATLPKRINYIVRDLLISGYIQGRIVNHKDGNLYNGIPFTDEQVINWGKQFDSYGGNLINFLSEINQFLLAIPLSTNRLTDLMARAGIQHAYEWVALDDRSKVQPIRKILFEFLSTPEFQLA